MREKLRAHLVAIYGEAVADQWIEPISKRIAEAKSRCGTAQLAFKPLTECDAMLITYADQVTTAGEAPLATLAAFLGDRVADCIPDIHILPFYPSSSDDGFSVMDYYQVDPAFGDWDDIARFRGTFELMFDAVFNHASAQGYWFAKFLAGEPGWEHAFFTVEGDPDLTAVVRPRTHPLLTTFQTASGPARVWTTFSTDQADINVSDPRMLVRLIDVFLFYLENGARFIRLDAIAFLWKVPGTTSIHLEQTHRAVQLFRAVAEAVDPGVTLITETNVPHDLNISYFGDGTDEAHMVYNFALPPLVFHTLRTGNADRLTSWAAGLKLPGDTVTFFNFLASHDGIGVNPARGILDQDEINALVETTLAHGGMVSEKSNPDGSTSPYELNINFFDALNGGHPLTSAAEATAIDRMAAAHAILLALRGMPGIYFHSIFGSRGDRAGAETSGIARRINRQKFDRAALDARLNDPTSREARVFSRLREMLVVRRLHAAFHPAAPQTVIESGPEVFQLVRGSAEAQVFCAVNVTANETTIALPGGFADGGAVSLADQSPITGPALTLNPYEWKWVGASRDGCGNPKNRKPLQRSQCRVNRDRPPFPVEEDTHLTIPD